MSEKMCKFEYTIEIIREDINTLEGSVEMVKTGKSKYYTMDDVHTWEKQIEEHKGAIITLQMVASGKLRVI